MATSTFHAFYVSTKEQGSAMHNNKKCGNCGWILNPWQAASTAKCPNCWAPLSQLSANMPRTQKGKGLLVLRNEVYPYSTLNLHGIAQCPADLDAPHIPYPIFARPAPSEAKHGYIDSRVVDNKEEALALLEQVLKDDPGGELLLCSFIKARYNMIWTPTSLAIGLGHDGATVGKGTITIPLVGAVHEPLKGLLGKAGIKHGEQPYIEAVMPTATGSPVLTQLRSGPKIEALGDYIPEKTLVLKVIKADPSQYKDRDWEKEMEALAGTPGLVVWHPGGTNTDHFSIHAFANKIPILYGKDKPSIGDILKPSANVGKLDPHAMLLGLAAGNRLKLVYGKNTGPAVVALLMAVHNAMAMTGEHSRWLGFAAAIMLRLGATGLRGEARHLGIWKQSKPTKDTVYAKALNYSLSRHRACVSSLVNIFRYGQWDSGGFGGMKWALCGAATVALFQAVKLLAEEPCEKTASMLVKALNMAVNQAHNGGWWLNKFIVVDRFNRVQEADVPVLLEAVPVLFSAGKLMNNLKPAIVKEEIARIAKWPDTDLRPPSVRSARLVYQPGISALTLELNTRLLGTKMKSITVTLPSAPSGEWSAEALRDAAYLVGTPEGYRVELRQEGTPAVLLWQDESLEDQAAEKAAKFNPEG